MILSKFVLLVALLINVSVEWANERVVKAWDYSRPMSTSSSIYGLKHYGTVVETDLGNRYLIHHPGPGQATTVTSAYYMSTTWINDGRINVMGQKTVGGVLSEIGPGYWIDAYTCLGARIQARSYLEK